MRASKVRKLVPKIAVRNTWKENLRSARLAGFGAEVIYAIQDDREDLSLCWCCGRPGYQEIAHIIPHSLGGKCEPQNLFLLCDECHTLAPDMLDSSYFVRFVNDRAGSYGKQVAKVIDSALAKVVELFKENPDDAERIVKNMQAGFSGQMDEKLKMTASHGVQISTSTYVSTIEKTLDSGFARYNEEEAMIHHAPWRMLGKQEQLSLI